MKTQRTFEKVARDSPAAWAKSGVLDRVLVLGRTWGTKGKILSLVQVLQELEL